jgi:hypothetical protein
MFMTTSLMGMCDLEIRRHELQRVNRATHFVHCALRSRFFFLNPLLTKFEIDDGRLHVARAGRGVEPRDVD